MKSRLQIQLTVACVFLCLLGCSSAMQLAYTKPMPATAYKGEIYVNLEDQRSQHGNGDDPLKVGTARNGFGMPFDIKAAPNREPSKVTKELVSECLAAAGYKVVDQKHGVPQLHAVLTHFYSDGYQHSRMGLIMPLELKRNEKSKPAWKYDMDVNTGYTWRIAGMAQLNTGYTRMLEAAKETLLEQFKNPEFDKKYRSLK